MYSNSLVNAIHSLETDEAMKCSSVLQVVFLYWIETDIFFFSQYIEVHIEFHQLDGNRLTQKS